MSLSPSQERALTCTPLSSADEVLGKRSMK